MGTCPARVEDGKVDVQVGLQGVAVAEHTARGHAHQRQMLRLASIEQEQSQATKWSTACWCGTGGWPGSASRMARAAGSVSLRKWDAMAWCVSLPLENCCLHIQVFAMPLKIRSRKIQLIVS